METGALGVKRPLNLDALSDEAVAALDGAADRLREMSQLLRAAYDGAAGDIGGDQGAGAEANDLARARELLARLEVSERSLRETARVVEQPDDPGLANAPATGPTTPSPEQQLAILRAQESERARLANELHDGPAQALANLIFQSEIVDRAVRQDATAGARELADIRRMLEAELETLRAYINQLRPPLIESDGLDDALREAASRLAEHDGLPVEVSLEASGDAIDETARAVALRIAQEALRNVGKHAAATRVWLHTRLEPADTAGAAEGAEPYWVMEIGDDGRGFEPAAIGGSTARRHFGLRFMRERSELLGARLSIKSHTNAGTVVRLSIQTRGKGK